jgi:hypothetical protein
MITLMRVITSITFQQTTKLINEISDQSNPMSLMALEGNQLIILLYAYKIYFCEQIKSVRGQQTCNSLWFWGGTQEGCMKH